MVAETYWQLFTDINHWLFEFTVEGVTFMLALIPFKKGINRWVKRHDREHHHEQVYK